MSEGGDGAGGGGGADAADQDGLDDFEAAIDVDSDLDHVIMPAHGMGASTPTGPLSTRERLRNKLQAADVSKAPKAKAATKGSPDAAAPKKPASKGGTAIAKASGAAAMAEGEEKSKRSRK